MYGKFFNFSVRKIKKSTLTNKSPPFVHRCLPDDLETKIFKVDIQGNNVLSAFKKITDNGKSQNQCGLKSYFAT